MRMKVELTFACMNLKNLKFEVEKMEQKSGIFGQSILEIFHKNRGAVFKSMENRVRICILKCFT